MKNNNQSSPIIINLDQSVHQLAKKFASEQPSREKFKQVYLNTLSIYAVKPFLDWVEIPTDVESSDACQNIIRYFQNTADLVIPDLGKLECLPVLPGQTVINLSVEVTEDRIGYVAVQFTESLEQATLLGFTPALDPEQNINQIALSDLQPMEEIVDYLERLEAANDFLNSDDPVAQEVMKRLDEYSVSEIVAQLDRIYQRYEAKARPALVSNLFANYFLLEAEENTTPNNITSEYEQLAGEILTRLGEIWELQGENNQLLATNASISEQITTNISELLKTGINSISQWFNNEAEVIDKQFETIKEFLARNTSNERVTFRLASVRRSHTTTSEATDNTLSSTSRVTEFQILDKTLMLVVSCENKSESSRLISLKLYPSKNDQFLPVNLKMELIDLATDTVFNEVIATENEPRLLLELQGYLGECFAVQFTLNDQKNVGQTSFLFEI